MRNMRAYIFVAHDGSEFAIIAQNESDIRVQDVAREFHVKEFGAGTNDKFNGPVRSMPCDSIYS